MPAVFTNPSGSVTYADNGSYDAAGKWISGEQDSVEIGAPQRLIKGEPSPGVDGQITVDYGMRSQSLSFKVIYVGPDEDTLCSAWAADSAIISNVCTVTYGGVQHNACVCDPAATRLGKVKSTGLPSGTFYATATVRVESKRTP
jgi:hypothetical protein